MFGFNDAADGPGAAMEIWDRAAVIVQVESKLGADMAAEMAAVPGGQYIFVADNVLQLTFSIVDALMVGPGKWHVFSPPCTSSTPLASSRPPETARCAAVPRANKSGPE